MCDLINILSIIDDKTQLINFPKLDPNSFKPAVLALIQRLKDTVASVKASDKEPTWDTLVTPIEDASENLSYVWSVVEHLNSVADTPELRATINELLPPISEVFSELGMDEELYAKYKALKAEKAFEKFSSTRQRIINKELEGFVLSGAELDDVGKKKMAEINREEAELSQKFSENLLDCTNEFALYLPEDTDELKGVPEAELHLYAQQAAAEGAKGYKITLHMPNYLPIMQYAENRELREKMYHAYVTRASEFSPAGKDNLPIINRLLELRVEDAHLLGYKNFAEVSLVRKMAESPEQVVSFLRELAAKAKPAAEKEMEELIDYGKNMLGIKDVQTWDLSFISEKLREAKFSYSENEVKQYFTEPAVLKGMFGLVEKMFSIKIKEKKAPVWNDDVKFFVIEDKEGKEIAGFYMDLYARNGKRGGAWMNDQISRREVDGKIQKPIAYLVCNFAAPVGDNPSLLTLRDVETIFHEFGHGLHHMLTRQTELAVSGISGVEWDAVEMPSQFMENFVLNWDVMQTITHHVKTGKTMPRELFDKLVAAKNYGAGMANVRQIEFALFDMLLHMDTHPEKDAVQKILTAVRKEVAVTFPPEYNRFANSFSHIFAGGYAATTAISGLKCSLRMPSPSSKRKVFSILRSETNGWTKFCPAAAAARQWTALLLSAAVNLSSTHFSVNMACWRPNEHHDYDLERQFSKGSSAAGFGLSEGNREQHSLPSGTQDAGGRHRCGRLQRSRIYAGCIWPENLQRCRHNPS